ncbi:hypothetical protein GEMRC1_009753 [Eukaryota sp. GEM-RC1]
MQSCLSSLESHLSEIHEELLERASDFDRLSNAGKLFYDYITLKSAADSSEGCDSCRPVQNVVDYLKIFENLKPWLPKFAIPSTSKPVVTRTLIEGEQISQEKSSDVELRVIPNLCPCDSIILNLFKEMQSWFALFLIFSLTNADVYVRDLSRIFKNSHLQSNHFVALQKWIKFSENFGFENLSLNKIRDLISNFY